MRTEARQLPASMCIGPPDHAGIHCPSTCAQQESEWAQFLLELGLVASLHSRSGGLGCGEFGRCACSFWSPGCKMAGVVCSTSRLSWPLAEALLLLCGRQLPFEV